MQIILMEKVINLGQLGDIVNVKNGYARNYLIPQGKAKRATEQAKAEFEARRAELEKNQAQSLASAQALAAKLDGLLIQITQKAGHDGKLFGSVTNMNIIEALTAQGFTIQKSMLRMPNGPLKTVGDHTLTIGLHTDVTTHITVSVLGETVA
ncbi:MAG TPA: 50S ribosomal protein L9 [Nitrosomonas sp.]|nr:50S ribosomal protein L9 [Nitrosomonas sp.]HQU97314.1 50S ribosomal protein L9 [Nitrosomonas sp.]HQX12584.1 50S ribosomal protein L9 [Nitrosomonas sp.]HRB20557.1 50S ribosomal protein L9 [Nitrosomonas sp.]HRB32192.1 50S ribosomal protein L9 [Nitrosomonas sp.]